MNIVNIMLDRTCTYVLTYLLLILLCDQEAPAKSNVKPFLTFERRNWYSKTNVIIFLMTLRSFRSRTEKINLCSLMTLIIFQEMPGP
jgi:Fe-S oxidoreductase